MHRIVDDLLASDAMIFLCSCLLSYSALRIRAKQRSHRLENAADIVFLVALSILVLGSALIVWAVV